MMYSVYASLFSLRHVQIIHLQTPLAQTIRSRSGYSRDKFHLKHSLCSCHLPEKHGYFPFFFFLQGIQLSFSYVIASGCTMQMTRVTALLVLGSWSFLRAKQWPFGDIRSSSCHLFQPLASAVKLQYQMHLRHYELFCLA